MIAAIATTVTLDMNTIILAVISLVGTCVTGFLALRMATLSTDQREAKVEQAKTVENLKEIHVAVNSGKTAMENKIDELNKVILNLSGTIKTLEESKRGAELAKAIASVPPVMVTPVVVPVLAAVAPGPAAQAPKPAHTPTTLDNAIEELTEAAKETVDAAEQTVALTDKVKIP